MADKYMYQGSIIASKSDISFFRWMLTRPLAIFFMILIIAALFAPLVSKVISTSYQKKHGEITSADDE